MARHTPQAGTVRARSMHGIALMVCAVGLLTVNDALAKYLAQTYPIGQILWLRHLAVLLVILAYAATMTGFAALKPVNWAGQLLRGTLFIGGTAFLVWAVKLLPLATVMSLTMSSPIFVAALSVSLLGEPVSRARWFAILGGFAGVLIIVRPGGQAFEWALVIALASALANGLRDLVTRRIARTETSIAMLFWSNLVVACAGLATLSGDWVALTTTGVALFAFAGLLNAGAHFVLIEAMRHGEAALVAPFRYTALLWAALIGFIVWGEVPSVWVVVGGLVIAASGIVMILAEARASLRRR